MKPPVGPTTQSPADNAPDVLVLGGGVIGCAVALALRDRGLQVTVVERGEPAREASWAAAGILAPQAEAHGPGPFLQLALASRARWGAWAAALAERTGLDVAYRHDGTLVLALDEDHQARLEARLDWQRQAGLRVERLSPAELAEREPSVTPRGCRMALRFPDDHQVDPRRLAPSLLAACAHAGVRFVTASARRVLHDGARATGADLDGVAVSAGAVVVACGAWSALLDGAGLPARAVEPLRGQMIELSTGLSGRPVPLSHVVFGHGGYLVPRSDGRVLCGSTEEKVGFRKEVTPAGLATLGERAARLCPALSEARVLDSWSGLRPSTPDGLPLIGPTALAGLHAACGHHRNGILLAPITAELIAGSLTGGVPVPAAFSPARFQ
jgi:glycine oxidase